MAIHGLSRCGSAAFFLGCPRAEEHGGRPGSEQLLFALAVGDPVGVVEVKVRFAPVWPGPWRRRSRVCRERER